MTPKRESPRGNVGVGVFLQARIGSTRLKEKVLLSLAGRTAVEHAMMSLRCFEADIYLLLTDWESSRRLEPYARRCGFEVFPGSSEDVLARYAGALREHQVDRIVRATADNPLVSSDLAIDLLRLHVAGDADFSGFIGMPLGLGVEIVESEALLLEDREATDPYEREHVNPFLYRRPERFSILRPQVPAAYRMADRSVTLDTAEDYRYLTELFDELYSGRPIETLRVLDWLKRHPRSREAKEAHPGKEGALRSVG